MLCSFCRPKESAGRQDVEDQRIIHGEDRGLSGFDTTDVDGMKGVLDFYRAAALTELNTIVALREGEIYSAFRRYFNAIWKLYFYILSRTRSEYLAEEVRDSVY